MEEGRCSLSDPCPEALGTIVSLDSIEIPFFVDFVNGLSDIVHHDETCNSSTGT